MVSDGTAVPGANAGSLADSVRSGIAENQALWDGITKLAAPAAVIISSSSYAAAFAFRQELLNSFGINSAIVSYSVQDSITFGFLFFLVGCSCFLMLLGVCMGAVSNVKLPRFTPSSRVGRFVQSIANSLRPANYFNILMMLSLIGLGSGSFAGHIRALQIKMFLNDGCQIGCHYYRLLSGQTRGIILAQTPDTTIIASHRSVYILKTTDLLSISPITRDRSWSY